jgi:glycine cleavage system H protein
VTEFLETTVDKFTFRVPTDRLYTDEGLWVLEHGAGAVRIGLSDFLQQSSGDVAFAEVKPAGTPLSVGDEIATVETVKTVLEIASPVAGVVVETNPAMASAPEVINRDPYERGWLAVIKAEDKESVRGRLLSPQSYFLRMKSYAEQEVSKP